MVRSLFSPKCDMEILKPIIVLITPFSDRLQYEYQEDLYELRGADLSRVHDLELEDGTGLRFMISEKKVNAVPIIIQEFAYFSPMWAMMYDSDDKALPFHCETCADDYMRWFDAQQNYWGYEHHDWYREYFGSVGEEGAIYH